MTKILVIEDEESVRENLLDMLEAEDFDTVAAANGRIGVQLALAEVPDLILCDMMLPELDGYGVLTTLRQETATAAIPFIFITARSAKADFRQGMELGADDYITKPFTRAELLSAIATRLQRQATLKNHLSTTTKLKVLSPQMQVLASNLRRALERGQFRQFQVYYQPQVNIHSGKIIAAESLLRWQSPELGMVSTAELISVAESTGLILPLDEWVLQTVCQQIKLWCDAGFTSLHISVNLSARQFNQTDIHQKIFDILAANQLQPQFLEIELTESTIMQDVKKALSTMQQLQAIGVKVAIDDFGTGYSSLSYLKNFPFNTLKIDRSFIRNITTEPKNSAITTALIQMAHQLNLKVVAEGVKTETELAFLREHNCDAMQGFLFSNPLPAAEFEKLLQADKRLSM